MAVGVSSAGQLPSQSSGEKRFHRIADGMEPFSCRSQRAPRIVILCIMCHRINYLSGTKWLSPQEEERLMQCVR